MAWIRTLKQRVAEMPHSKRTVLDKSRGNRLCPGEGGEFRWVRSRENFFQKERQSAVIGVSILTGILTRWPDKSLKVEMIQCLQGIYEVGGERGIRTHGTF